MEYSYAIGALLSQNQQLDEAARRALNIAPGLGRRFAFEQWPDFDAPLWDALQEEARRQQRQAPKGDCPSRTCDLSKLPHGIAPNALS